MNLFVAVATGQNVANLPPMLQFAKAGDRVLWLESDLAARLGWADGAVEVLRGRGLQSHRTPIEGDINEPRAVERALAGWLDRHGGDFAELNIVLNGGQKLTPFGLALAARPWREQLGKPVRFLYGDDRPARVQVRKQHVGARMQIFRYDADRMLSLEEVVQVNGMECRERGRLLPIEATRLVNPYGRDPEFTRMIHLEASQPEKLEFASPDWPSFKDWSKNSTKVFRRQVQEKVKKTMGNYGLHFTREPHPDFWLRLSKSMVKIVRNFSLRSRQSGLSHKDRERMQSHGWLKGEGRGLSTIEWKAYEQAVAERVQAFLASHPDLRAIVRELRCNPKLEQGSDEWDVVLTLVNGVVLHLECKSWKVERKDFNSRSQVVQSAASRLARVYIVKPLFPEFASEPWFEDMHKSWVELEGFLGRSLIAFTMLDSGLTRPTYTVPGLKGEFPWPEQFEVALERLLAPYARDSRATSL